MWFKVDDGLPAHRKTRAAIKGHREKTRDASTMGVWVLAGAWAALNETDGWVPEEELDRWDDDWESIAERLAKAGFWYRVTRDGEPGYSFHDWLDRQPPSNLARDSGAYGAHVRWHVGRGVVDPDCEHCPTDPMAAQDPPNAAPDSPPIATPSVPQSGDLIAIDSSTPTPTPTPTPRDLTSSVSCASTHVEREAAPPTTEQLAEPRERKQLDADWSAWWAAYPRKRGKGQALRAYRTARKKATAEELLTAISQQSKSLTARGAEYCPYPATWLNGERWTDQPDPTSRAPAKVSAREEMFQRQLERAQLKEQQTGIS